MNAVAVARGPRPTWGRLEIGVLVVLSVALGIVLSWIGEPGVGAALTTGWVTVLLALAWWDLRERRIPNVVVYPAMVIALALAPLSPERSVPETLVGGGLGLGVGFGTYFVARGGFGGGDVKLLALVGLLAGYPGAAAVMLVGALLAFAYGAASIPTGVDLRLRPLPLAPFIALGMMLCSP